MKIILVDAENVGLKGVKSVNASILDKVFVFSKNEGIQQHCNKSLFISVTDYPTGSNQADFLIISYLSRILASLKADILKATDFELVTNDEALISAYEFICQSFNATYQTIRTNKKEEIATQNDDTSEIVSLFLKKIEEFSSEQLQQEIPIAEKARVEKVRKELQTATISPISTQKEVISLDQVNAEKKILKALNKAHSLDDTLREKLLLPKATFTRALNALIRNNLIKRSTESKKKWIKAS